MTARAATGYGRQLRTLGWSAAAAVLIAPAVAMQFTHEVNWSAVDFAIAAVMLGTAGGAVEMFARAPNALYRLAGGMAVVTALLLAWVNLAVGIIGSENNPANWMYAGVLATAFGGAGLARMRPAGMARALLATAAAQLLAGGLAVAMHWGLEGVRWPKDIVGATVIFTLLWLGAAALFGRSARSSR